MATLIDELTAVQVKTGEPVTVQAEGRLAGVKLQADGCYQGFISEVWDGETHTFVTDSGPFEYVVRLLRSANEQERIQ